MRIAVTIGDPSGIGPEVIAKATATWSRKADELVVFGSRALLPQVAAHVVDVYPSFDRGRLVPGQPSADCARMQRLALDAALTAARAGQVDAIVTAPWTKAAFAMIGEPVVGHTELLAEAFGVRDRHAMMLAGDRLRVSLVTTHIPLADVATQITRERVRAVTELTALELRRSFGVDRPRLAVCGLNPHAGEGGHMGREDLEIVGPAIEDARTSDVAALIEGPLPSDSLFPRFRAGAPYDGVVAMYHDQGLIPLKTLHFGESANVTLGLPVVRTSVDHGTAHDIAGRGVADPGSMIYALELAATMVENRRGR